MVRHVGLYLVGLGFALLALGLALSFGSKIQATGFVVAKGSNSITDYWEGLVFCMSIISIIMGTLFLARSSAH